MPTRERRLRERLAGRLVAASDVATVMSVADEVVRTVVPAEGAAWGTVDPASGLSTSCHVFGRLTEESEGVLGTGAGRERRLFELDWAEDGPATFGSLVREGRSATGLRLEVGDPRGVRRYDDLLAPAGVHDELRLSLTMDGEPWATGILYRWSGTFTGQDVELAAVAAPLVASAVRASLLRAVCDHDAVDVPPGSLVLDADGRVVVSSPAAKELLAGLEPGQLRAALASVHAATRTRGRASLTVAGPGGVRALHGAPATPGTGEPAGDHGVIVVVELPRPAALAPLLLRALGLTSREREIAQHLLVGRPRTLIARALGLSDYTLGDHVRNVYRKAGVSGRAELAALLYDGYYARPRAARVAPNPYGWFALSGSLPA